MKNLKSFKLFESSSNKPQLRFPTDKVIHYNYITEILENAGINPHDIKIPNHKRSGSIHSFFSDKFSDDIVFPKLREKEVFTRAESMIFRENVFLIPATYDTSLDQQRYDKRKEDFFKSMRDTMGEKEFNKQKKNLEKHVEFGPSSFEWVVPIFKLIHDKLSQYYVNGELRVWMPEDTDYDHWKTYDYPHKYDVVGNLDRPNGVYYLSDLEKFIESKYGIKDEMFYDFIIKNEYIEGRHWERVFSIGLNENGKLERGGGKYGMEATENIEHMLNIIELEFKSEFKKSDYEGFPIYMDYYKEVKQEY